MYKKFLQTNLNQILKYAFIYILPHPQQSGTPPSGQNSNQSEVSVL